MQVQRIDRKELRTIATTDQWTSDDLKMVERIVSEWLNQQKASSVLVFFNRLNRLAVVAYVAFFKEDDSIPIFEQSVLDFPWPNSEKKVIGLSPSPADDPPSQGDQEWFQKQAADWAYWDRHRSYLVVDTGAKKMTTETWADMGKVEFRHIQHAREKMKRLQDSFKRRHPDFDFAKAYSRSIQVIENMQNEFDRESGFSDLRRGAHDYALRLPDASDGLFSAAWIERFYSFVQKFLEKVHPASLIDFDVRVAGTAPTSAVLLLDIVSRRDDEAVIKIVNDTKAHLRAVVEATPILQTMGDPDQRVDEFCEKAKLAPEAARELMTSIGKMFPSFGEPTFEVYIPTQPKPITTFEADASKNFDRAHKALKDSLRETDDLVVEGILGQLAVWPGEPPRFQIRTADRRKLTITYDPSREAEVQSKLRQTVKVERKKVSRSWHLVAWK